MSLRIVLFEFLARLVVALRPTPLICDTCGWAIDDERLVLSSDGSYSHLRCATEGGRA